jgi:hypothetical protein
MNSLTCFNCFNTGTFALLLLDIYFQGMHGGRFTVRFKQTLAT